MSSPLIHLRTKEDMHSLFNNLYTKRERRPSLKVIAVLTRLHPSRLKDLVQENDLLSKKYHIESTRLEPDLYRLTIRKDMPAGGSVSGEAIVDSKVSGWVALTMGKHYFTRTAIEGLLDSLYPTITRIYFNYAQISTLIEKVKELYGGLKLVTYFAIRREVNTSEGLQIQRKTLRGIGAERELMDEAKKGRIWIESIRFRVKKRNGITLLECLITSKGLARLIYGNFTDFYKNVVDSILEISRKLDGDYNKVKREILVDDIKLHPCTITYPLPFRSDHFKRLVSRLANYYMLPVTHAGNPYFVADLLDHQDGSSFGLTVLGNVITISPMLRTTSTSLWRLTEIIQTLLGEGKIAVAEVG